MNSKKKIKLMILGTGSDSGKSLLVTAFCRILKRSGYTVAPFKAQNMALNSFVTMDGGEMGRAQVIQAFAAGIPPEVDMNPVLLKPSGGKKIQIIIRGKVFDTKNAEEYYNSIDMVKQIVIESFKRLEKRFDAVILEGAGSAVELNLIDRDIVNIPMAKWAHSPAVLVGDIEKGGIFASLIGSIMLLSEEDREYILGTIVNKFRGDVSLFEEGVKIIEEKTGKPVFGVMPYIDGLLLPEEDSVSLTMGRRGKRGGSAGVRIAVVLLPFISNYTDFDPFELEEGVLFWYARSPEELGNADFIILPGTKNTIKDLIWLKKEGFDKAIRSAIKHGKTVAGICGGFQMMGLKVCDPHHVESEEEETPGLGLLPVETVLEREKYLSRVRAVSLMREWGKGVCVEGYEIHMGRSTIVGNCRGSFRVIEKNGISVNYMDGAVGDSGKVWGTYIHGIFENDDFRTLILEKLGRVNFGSKLHYREYVDEQFDRLADIVEDNISVEAILKSAEMFNK